MLIASVFFVVFGIIILLTISWFFFHAISMLRGAPYVESKDESIAFAAVHLKDCRRIADIGSGDGLVLLALARATGAELHGYEINPFLVWQSRWHIRRAGLTARVHIHWGNLWRQNFNGFDGIYVYGLPPIMSALGTKLGQELAPGAFIVSAAFPFPDWQPDQTRTKTFLYTR